MRWFPFGNGWNVAATGWGGSGLRSLYLMPACFFAAFVLLGFRTFLILMRVWVVTILAGRWDFARGLSCRDLSLRGTYESDEHFCGSTVWMLLQTTQVLGDVRHHRDTGMHQRFLHGEP